MEQLKDLCYVVPRGCCPCCAGKQFIIIESQINYFLTNQFGEIIDHDEKMYDAQGYCLSCKNKYPMMQTSYGFIPLTPLREILYNRSKEENAICKSNNPMQIGDD